jgi:hypothetical protein
MSKTWDQIPGFFNYAAFYDKVAEECPDGCSIVELGCWQGRSICYLATQLKTKKPRVRLFAVDYWHETFEDFDSAKALRSRPWFYRTFCDNLVACGVNDRVFTVPAESAVAAQYFDDGSLWMVFIDAQHEYTHVNRDIVLWAPKVQKGGWLTGHDYDDRAWPGVKKAVDEFGKPETFGSVWRIIV